ncbi:hypothetical protein QBC43DRAFT_338321 [Cladorrhinum sp. PSN259]|nr:hypothetical protein QBC43DRAFT_338321 [Cladorrhinum sp. PSN259]
MVSFKARALHLLQVVALFSSASAGPCRACSPKDKLLQLMLAQETGVLEPFCAGFLAPPTSTAQITVTPTTAASGVVSTVVVTEVSTFIEEIVTVTEPATVTVTDAVQAITFTVYPDKKRAKRSVDYPEWLSITYSPDRVSSACKCLSISPSDAATVTATATAEPVTVTEEGSVVTRTTTSIVTDIGVTTVVVMTTVTVRPSQPPPAPSSSTSTSTSSAMPAPSSVAKRALVQVLRKDTGSAAGWLYMSSGPAITTDPTVAVPISFSVSSDATTATRLRFSPEGYSPNVLGFNTPASVELRNYYGSLIAAAPTPAGSGPVTSGSSVYETDIWTLDTATNMVGWEWVGKDGLVTTSETLRLYRVGGRAYPVGNVNSFNTAFASVSAASKYEIQLKLVMI